MKNPTTPEPLAPEAEQLQRENDELEKLFSDSGDDGGGEPDTYYTVVPAGVKFGKAFFLAVCLTTKRQAIPLFYTLGTCLEFIADGEPQFVASDPTVVVPDKTTISDASTVARENKVEWLCIINGKDNTKDEWVQI